MQLSVSAHPYRRPLGVAGAARGWCTRRGWAGAAPTHRRVPARASGAELETLRNLPVPVAPPSLPVPSRGLPPPPPPPPPPPKAYTKRELLTVSIAAASLTMAGTGLLVLKFTPGLGQQPPSYGGSQARGGGASAWRALGLEAGRDGLRVMAEVQQGGQELEVGVDRADPSLLLLTSKRDGQVFALQTKYRQVDLNDLAQLNDLSQTLQRERGVRLKLCPIPGADPQHAPCKPLGPQFN